MYPEVVSKVGTFHKLLVQPRFVCVFYLIYLYFIEWEIFNKCTMNRKLSLSNIALLSVGISSMTCQAQAPAKPNVIYIYADDMGKGMLSAYGQRHFTTPNIDRMVTKGTSFDNAYG